MKENESASEEDEGLYCPKCRSHYRPGFNKCADCDVPLVKELPPEEGLEYVNLVEVFTSLDASQVMFVKSLLGGSGIKFVVQGDNHFVRGNFLGALSLPARFLVPADQVQNAKALLKDL